MFRTEYLVLFTTYSSNYEQISTRVFTSKVKAMIEVRQMKACGHSNVRLIKKVQRAS